MSTAHGLSADGSVVVGLARLGCRKIARLLFGFHHQLADHGAGRGVDGRIAGRLAPYPGARLAAFASDMCPR